MKLIITPVNEQLSVAHGVNKHVKLKGQCRPNKRGMRLLGHEFDMLGIQYNPAIRYLSSRSLHKIREVNTKTYEKIKENIKW